MHNYKLCEEFTEEMGEIKRSRCDLEAELKELEKKDMKSMQRRESGRLLSPSSLSLSSDCELTSHSCFPTTFTKPNSKF